MVSEACSCDRARAMCVAAHVQSLREGGQAVVAPQISPPRWRPARVELQTASTAHTRGLVRARSRTLSRLLFVPIADLLRTQGLTRLRPALPAALRGEAATRTEAD